MDFSTLKTTFAGMAIFLAASLLFADAIVDKDFDDNQNEFEYYWYYYDDNSGVGPNDRPQLFPDLTPTIVNVDYTEVPRNGYNGEDPSDTWKVKKYKFTTGEHLGKKCAILPFTFGDAWEADYCSAGKACAMPFVGIGTMLNKEWAGLDITGAKKLHFSAKSAQNTLTDVTFKIETLDINEFAYKPGDQMTGKEFGYFGKIIEISNTEWVDYSVDIPDDLSIPTWAEKFDFDIKNCTKLAWEIKGDGEITGDTVFIADVYFTGEYEFVSPSMWMPTVETRPNANMFSTFQGNVPQGSPIGTWWYAYNDVEIGGTSTVAPSSATKDEETGRLLINFTEGTGFNDQGTGAALDYTFGPAVMKQDTIPILGFVGIGVNLYDSTAGTYFNADSAGVTDVFFEYMTDAGAKYVTLEVSDFHDVGDINDPTRKDSRGSGVVHYRNFPPTGGTWRRVQIPLDSLVTHDSWEGYTEIALDKTRLAKLQWKVQGGDKIAGYYAIDNVALPAGSFDVTPDAVSTPAASMAKSGAFNAVYKKGTVNVNWTGATKLAKGTVHLVNTRGAVVASVNVAANSSFASKLSAANIAAGMYFVSLEGTDVNGKTVASRTVMNIVK